MGNLFGQYEVGDFYDEMFSGPGEIRPHYGKLLERFGDMLEGDFERKQALASNTFLNQGITFTVYSDNKGTERIMPFDMIPRIIPQQEWELVERGLTQRIRALNLFLHDVYHDRRILKEGIIPTWVVESAKHYRPE